MQARGPGTKVADRDPKVADRGPKVADFLQELEDSVCKLADRECTLGDSVSTVPGELRSGCTKARVRGAQVCKVEEKVSKFGDRAPRSTKRSSTDGRWSRPVARICAAAR